MEIIETPWDLLSALLVFLVGLFIILKISRTFNANWRRSALLYFWHTIFCVIYLYYVVEFGGDAIVYYDVSRLSVVDFSFGTFAITFLTRIFSHYLDFSILGTFLIYNIFGAIGLLAFDASLRCVSYDKIKIVRVMATLLVFLPSVSFWSAGIGKDAIAFMATGLVLWAAIDFNRRVRLMMFSIFVMLLVRPHMAGLMTIALAGGMLFRGQISLAKKSALILVSFAAVAIAVPFSLQYAGLGESGQEVDFQDYVEKRQGYNQDGGAGIDISAMSPPMQLFTYVFRPLPFEAHSGAALAASFDNIVLFMVFALGVFGFFNYRKNSIIDPRENRIFMWIYCLSAWVILGVTTANLGISVRQKWMFVPMLVFLLISMMAKRKEFRGKKNGSRLPLHGVVPMKK
jgi:hypothetical protein